MVKKGTRSATTNSGAISRQLLHGSRDATAIMAFLLSGIRGIRRLRVFTSTISVTLYVSRRTCCNR
jgi:hypothetical protein